MDPAASAMLEAMFGGPFAVRIDYQRGDTVIASKVPAKMGSTLFRTDDPVTGFTVRYRQTDFLVRAADLPDLGEPALHDRILHNGRAYQVVAPSGEPVYAWHDRQECQVYRIHTKETRNS